MKKRLQANLRGDEDPKNQISRPTSSLASDPLAGSDLLPDPYALTSTLDHSQDQSLDPMVQDLVHGRSSSPSNQMTYHIPAPPPKTIAALENLSLGLPLPPPPPSHVPQETSARPIPVKSTPQVPYNARYNSFEAAVDDQLAGLCSSLKLDSNNNNTSAYSYPYNVSTNHLIPMTGV